MPSSAADLFNSGLNLLTEHKQHQHDLHGWFLFQEIKMNRSLEMRREGLDPDAPEHAGELLCRCVESLPLTLPEGSVLAGTQDDAFSPSYALINPAFQVESFRGYCDPTAIYADIAPSEEFPEERIRRVRDFFQASSFVKHLNAIYRDFANWTEEAVFFVEPVTGHMIPDPGRILREGLRNFFAPSEDDAGNPFRGSMRRAADAPRILARRYAELAEHLRKERTKIPGEEERLRRIAENCRKVPDGGAENLHEALQSFVLLWQTMCLEQAPNPYAFSAGNLDRLFEPYRKETDSEEAIALLRHLLAFFMVGARGWAISQNILLGGRDAEGNDRTTPMTGLFLEAFHRSNQPQPALSIKIHRNTPESLFAAMGKLFFTPGHSTPSLFNDDMMFRLLRRKGIREEDLSSWAVAGCQEPLIAGKENGNTTNSWLNLPKVLELTLNDGCSLLSGRKIGRGTQELGYASREELYRDLETAFFRQLSAVLPEMEKAANLCTRAVGRWATPFSSLLFGGVESGRDMRDPEHPGTRYNASGCLIHGLSVVTDSLTAVNHLLSEQPDGADRLLEALRSNFRNDPAFRARLLAYPKYGDRDAQSDRTACRLVEKISGEVSALRNPAGKPFMPDFSTPSTHLLYGYQVGATPDGRSARAMLGYGIDPRPEAGSGELTDQLISERLLPFDRMTGGYASHIGLTPALFDDFPTPEGKALAMRDRIIRPLFHPKEDGSAPFYVYFNIDSARHLRKILSDPRKYAPSGIYILRIHGTFVNFLDLAPAIQEDIIKRLERRECA